MNAPASKKPLSASLGYVLGRTFFQLRQADDEGEMFRPRGRAKLSVALNRALIERGLRAPWMWSPARCQEFWASIERGADGNAPNIYASKSTEIVTLLHDFWSPEVSASDGILEIGCNAGANLAALRKLGYLDVAGVEINRHAIAEMRRAFPDLGEEVVVHQGRIEEVLPTLATGSVDVVFAMAVLHHIHPASRAVFAEMVRVARRHVCVLEPEQCVSHYVFCRDYRRVFERLGAHQLRALEIGRASFPHVASDYRGYTARLFRVPRC